MIAEQDLPRDADEQRFPQVEGYDYIEYYVGNAHQAAHFYRTAFGLTPVAYAGLETGERSRVSYVLQQGQIRLVLTSALRADDPAAEHVRLHGDGVKDIALTVRDATAAFHESVKRGARPVAEPRVCEDEHGRVVKATVAAYGDTVHTFVERRQYGGVFLPNYQALKRAPPPALDADWLAIDHVAVCIAPDELDEWVGFYNETLGFRESHREDVATEYSAMNSKVVQSANGQVKFPLVEPARGRRRSQIEEYLEFYGGPGVQHVALLSDDIAKTVKALRSAGNEFLNIPGTYYESLHERVGPLEEEDVDTLRAQQILVDRDEWGYLLQTFTRPVQGRPTVFMEAIQRKGARGFGSGNIKALFEAVEREQAKRGNL
jgi:4-hydroxyphenylpyruvate dioxygenase